VGFKTMVAGVTVSSTGITPTLTGQRQPELSSDPGTLGRKPTAWADFGTVPLADNINTFGGFTAYYMDPGGKFVFPASWSLSFTFWPNNAQTIDDWLLGAGTEQVLDAASEVTGLVADSIYTVYFYASDWNLETGTGIPGGIFWGAFADGLTGDADFSDSVVQAKTYAGAVTFPQLRPRWYGANSLDFRFPVNVNTNVSTGTVYLRWRKGIHADKSTYDGQVEVAGSAKGTDAETYTKTLTGLDADSDYTVWCYVVRLTANDTSGTGPVSYVRTEATDTYDIAGATVSVTAAPRSGNFRYLMVASRTQYSKELYVPQSWIQTIKQTDYAASGWTDASLIQESPKIGPFYSEETRATRDYSGTSVYVLAAGENYSILRRTTVKARIGGTVDVTELTQSTPYRFRVVVALPSGNVYPFEGTFDTPDFEVGRQIISERFTLGSY